MQLIPNIPSLWLNHYKLTECKYLNISWSKWTSIKCSNDFSIPTWQQFANCSSFFIATFTSDLYPCFSSLSYKPLILPRSSVALIRRLTSLICLHSTGTASEAFWHLQAKSKLGIMSNKYFKIYDYYETSLLIERWQWHSLQWAKVTDILDHNQVLGIQNNSLNQIWRDQIKYVFKFLKGRS